MQVIDGTWNDVAPMLQKNLILPMGTSKPMNTEFTVLKGIFSLKLLLL